MCGIGANYSYVFQCPSPDPVDGVAIVFTGPLDTEEIELRLGHSLVEQESGAAGADFNLDGASPSENLYKIDSAIQIFGF